MTFKPAAFSEEKMGQAIEAARKSTGGRWLHTKATRRRYRLMVGNGAWEIAQHLAMSDSTNAPLRTPEARRCYNTGRQALGL